MGRAAQRRSGRASSPARRRSSPAAPARCRSARSRTSASTASRRAATRPPSPARSRSCSTCTAAASWSATSTPTTRPAACSAATRASTCWRSSTARRPSTRSRATSRTRARPTGGRPSATTRVAVGGDSAGGNLAATLAIEFDPVLALLIYPAVDATQERRSRKLFGKGFFLTDELMTWFTGHFMPEGSGPRRSAALADPAPGPRRTPRRRWSSPPASTRCATRARPTRPSCGELGVKTQLRRFPGLFHGFINSIGASPSSRDALVEVAGMTRALLRSA